ncbi:MAG TPA: ribosome silencing factor [Candidatus Acidoferrales bacterium]|nr:ribosome silencing factor [Candidatus Acidoferrales bacterium]
MERSAEIRQVVAAAQEKKAAGITLLDLAGLGAFTEAFVICTGFSQRQVQAISDGVEEVLARSGARLLHREGFDSAEWVLLDYGRFVVHIFSERARLFYDIERLWRKAPRVDLADLPAGRDDSSIHDGAASA